VVPAQRVGVFMFEKIKRFLKEVRVELTKVTWPSVHELRGSTGVVIITVLVLTIFIGIVDVGLAHLIGIFLR
jgi:preprotein translocase subunit SecE